MRKKQVFKRKNREKMRSYNYKGEVKLESGEIISGLEICYNIYGDVSNDVPIVWVCHALTASSNVMDWWQGLFGDDDLFNGEDYTIICANILGSHYGTTGPHSINPFTQKTYDRDFPLFTIRDMVHLHELLAAHLLVNHIDILIGGSLGGQQALEWAIMEPSRFSKLVLLATNAQHSPWGIAWNESQRWAIENDPLWSKEKKGDPVQGMEIARSIALLSYRNGSIYNKSQADEDIQFFPSKALSYQRYQGAKLAKRFNPYSYWYLSKAMDSHNVGRGRGSMNSALSRIKASTLILTIQNDLLFPLEDQLKMISAISHAQHKIIPSAYGHDGFLIETPTISKVISSFLSDSESLNFDFKSNKKDKLTIGLVGFGTVGQAFYNMTLERDDMLVTKIVVRDSFKKRPQTKAEIVYNTATLLKDSNIDLIVELISDHKVSFEIAQMSLLNGKHFITANKRMLAEHQMCLSKLADRMNKTIKYEAAVAGAIPILHTLETFTDKSEIYKIEGIVNGTCNFIMTKMLEEGLSYRNALERAQNLGFAEADPIMDMEAYDASFKSAILAYQWSGNQVHLDHIERTGISDISTGDINRVKKCGHKLKLIASLTKTEEGIDIVVKPLEIDRTHPFFNIENETNAVAVYSYHSGPITLIGKGAGGAPTASAVMSDALSIKKLESKKRLKVLV